MKKNRKYFDTKKEAIEKKRELEENNPKFFWRIYYDAFKSKYYICKFKKGIFS